MFAVAKQIVQLLLMLILVASLSKGKQRHSYLPVEVKKVAKVEANAILYHFTCEIYSKNVN